MIAIAREVEMNIIAHEGKMRKCEEIPPLRSTDTCSYEIHAYVNATAEVVVDARPKKAMAEKVQPKDRLGSRVVDSNLPDTRRCHRCQQEGHIARNFPNPREAQRGPPARRTSTRWLRTALKTSSARVAKGKVTPLPNAGKNIPNKF